MGSLESGRAGPILFGQGTLNVGEAMAVPVIRQLKHKHLPAAKGAVVILDAPPGTSCPVVETMRGADFVLLVTEPTPFGLHDLRLAVQVARDELGLPVGVVINRDGVGDAGVDEYCAAEGLPILMRIPLDRRIAEAISEGKALVEALPGYRSRFVGLYERISPGGGLLEGGPMKQLVILSGKGGTGKTSVAAALAHLASQEMPIVLADADVDAANLELVLRANQAGGARLYGRAGGHHRPGQVHPVRPLLRGVPL